TFSGLEGKMFEPMALTVILALVSAFVLSLTFVPALIAIAVTGRVKESDNLAVRRLKSCYAPLLKRAINRPLAAIATGVVLFLGALLL
ncbi:efflux RND transporter permease subunit, partial [Burkholderia contaminans]|nr:efflux RND transporter permease subunit [Burkholderia contaminans]